jgi:hypothetical protein
MASGISTKDLQKARRNAERKRASVACARCKAGKTKCSDYRPCKKCKNSNVMRECVDGDLSIRPSTETPSNSRSSGTRVHDWCMEHRPFMMQALSNDVHIRLRPAVGTNLSHPYSAGSLNPLRASGSICDYPTAGSADLKNAARYRYSNEPGESSQKPPHSDRPMLGPQVSTFTGLLANFVQAASTHDVLLQSDAPGFFQTHRSRPEPNQLLSQQVQYTREQHLGTTLAFPPNFHLSFPLLAALQVFPPPAVAALHFGCTTATAPAPSIDGSLLLSLQASCATPHPHPHMSR